MTAARHSAFDFVQPFQVVPRRTEVRNVQTEGWDIVATNPDSVITGEATAKHVAKPSAELLAQRARKNATYRRNAERKNQYSEIGRTGTTSNSARAPR